MNMNLLTSFRQALALAAQIWVLDGGDPSEGHDNPYEGDLALSLVVLRTGFVLHFDGSQETLRQYFSAGVECEGGTSEDRWDLASGRGESEEKAILELLHNLQVRIDEKRAALKAA